MRWVLRNLQWGTCYLCNKQISIQVFPIAPSPTVTQGKLQGQKEGSDKDSSSTSFRAGIIRRKQQQQQHTKKMDRKKNEETEKRIVFWLL